MKTKATTKTITPPDPSTEELNKLKDSLATYEALLEEKRQYEQLFSEVNSEVADFTVNGDLRNADKVSTMVVRQAQATLTEKRLESLTQRLADAERALDQQGVIVSRLIEVALHQIRNGTAAKIAKSLEDTLGDVLQARQQAFLSKPVRAIDQRISALKSIPHTAEGESIAVTKRYFSVARVVFQETQDDHRSFGRINSVGIGIARR